MLRWLLAFRHRLRDLGILVLIAQQVWRSLPEFAAVSIALLLLWAAMLATSATTHSKAVAVENRLNAYVAGTDQRIITLEAGTHINVQGHAVTLTSAADATLHCQALGLLTDTTNTTFLSGLSKLPHQSGLATDQNTGSSWATGERGFVNSSIDYINVLDGNLQTKGFMG